MKPLCHQFRANFEKQWIDNPDLETLLSKDDHWRSCGECEQFVQSYQELSTRLDRSKEAIPLPDFAELRMNVWSELEQKEQRQAWLPRLVKPVVFAPAAVVVIAIILFGFFQQSGNYTLDFSNEYFATVDSVATADYPSEQELQDMFDSEFENSVDNYIIENTSYTTIEQYFSNINEDWSQVLASLADQQI